MHSVYAFRLGYMGMSIMLVAFSIELCQASLRDCQRAIASQWRLSRLLIFGVCQH
jgi:hypothetical protein